MAPHDRAMPLNMIKLCVGVETVDDLKSFVAERRARASAAGEPFEQVHVTRVRPKRADEILDGGSLYWVIRGHVQLRQPILRLDKAEGVDGIERCRIVLAPAFIPTRWQHRRPFQGWRYLAPADAPADLDADAGDEGLPDELRRELTTLGLL